MDRTVPLLAAAAAGLILSAATALAGSATWLTVPSSGDWNASANWTPGGPPNGPADVATFELSAVFNVSISADTAVSRIVFGSQALIGYNVEAPSGYRLGFTGSGVTNDSGMVQNFRARADNGLIRFNNQATAGVDTSFTTEGGRANDGQFGVLEFRDGSSAGSGTFTTNGGTATGAFGGVTQFFDSATAANGAFASHGAIPGAGRGVTVFHNHSTAGNAALVASGGTGEHPFGGLSVFFDSSNAGKARLVAAGGRAAFVGGGIVQFFDDSTANEAQVTIEGGAVNAADGGIVQFRERATARRGVFLIQGGEHAGKGGATLEFHNDTSAQSGAFTTNGAGEDGAGFGYTVFRDNSTAGNATFITNGGAFAGATGGGLTEFYDNSTSAEASFVVNGTTVNNGWGGTVAFRSNSNAGVSTIVVNGSRFVLNPCQAEICTEVSNPNGRVGFDGIATAARARLIANGGIDGGDGGAIIFGGKSSGGMAQVELFGNGQLNIGSHEAGDGVVIGSLQGEGIVWLGANELVVGSNNLSTTFSGKILRVHPGTDITGGSLTKIGHGTLTISGAAAHTGATTINGGQLRVDGSVANTVVVNKGGTLGGSGIIGSLLVNDGGIVAPGGLHTLHIAGDYSQQAGGVLRLEIGGTESDASDHLDIGGRAALDGTLEGRFQNGFLPLTGQVFKLFDVAGALSGSFAQIVFPNLKPGFQFRAEFVNGTYQLTALNNGIAAHGFLNISTRVRVGTGDNVLIGGFIVTGSESKKVIIRGIGPSLAAGGTALPGRLADPTLELRDSAGQLLFANDDWGDGAQKQEIIASAIPPGHQDEAAIVATLAPGNYTAILRGRNNTTGIGVVEIYDLGHSAVTRLANISSRGMVESGDHVMIGGFIVDSQALSVVIRALGPSLPLEGKLEDPWLDLFDGNGNLLQSNDNWKETQQWEIEATTIPPSNDLEAAMVTSLPPGAYTAIVRGSGNRNGVGLVESYNVP